MGSSCTSARVLQDLGGVHGIPIHPGDARVYHQVGPVVPHSVHGLFWLMCRFEPRVQHCHRGLVYDPRAFFPIFGVPVWQLLLGNRHQYGSDLRHRRAQRLIIPLRRNLLRRGQGGQQDSWRI